MKKQELIEKYIALSAEVKGKNEMILSLNPWDHDARIVSNLINEIYESFIADLRKLEEKSYPDNEADGFVFCGKCGRLK
jgi:hypothetical protein